MIGLTLAALAVLVSATPAQVSDAGAAPDTSKDDATEEPAPVAPPGIEPPHLIASVPPGYPPEAARAGAHGLVVLRLTVAVTGAVTAAEIVVDPGHGLGAAVREAALQFTFEPARRNGSPLAVQISYTHTFPAAATPPPPASPVAGPPSRPTAPPAQPVNVEGHSDQPVQEVVVRDDRQGQRLQRSARAVTVIDTRQARRSSADLGEVVARREGVTVQRAGGLGSQSRFSLNGLTDDQVRFFLDGVPLDLAGFPLGLANVPVNLVERVEVYRGVMPAHLGADALGGGVNLVSRDPGGGTHAAASYQTGAFGTHRLSGVAQHRFEGSGFILRAALFADQADNDYLVDVQAPDAKGRLQAARVPRFHDGYRGAGGTFEMGWLGTAFADRLVLRLFASGTEREIQHDATMSIPYGEASASTSSAGATAHFKRRFGDPFAIEALVGYSFGRTRFVDVGRCVYTWFGTCDREQAEPGEIGANPRDTVMKAHAAYARATISARFGARQSLELAIAPTLTTRRGDERQQRDPSSPDPLNAPRRLATVVLGLEHQLRLLGDRLENIAFAKLYAQLARADETPSAGVTTSRDRQVTRGGAGDSIRLSLGRGLAIKASYEFATRLPRADETFGDGVLVEANLRLLPEISHNANLGLLGNSATSLGRWSYQLNAFVRDIDRLILLTGTSLYFRYDNATSARAIGAEGSFGWSSPGGTFALDASLTHQDLRTTDGTYRGDRVPNRPYLYGALEGRLRLEGLAHGGDSLTFAATSRYVHAFFLTWESLGARGEKAVVEGQLIHGAGATYEISLGATALALSFEAHNVTDAYATDFFGVQRPGRAVYVKVLVER